MTAAFDGARFLALTAELPLGRPLVVTAETGSTNDDALAAARDGAPHGALFVTERQRAGRGRRGNTWFSTAGEHLLFSLLLRPSIPVERAPGLALLAGLAVREAVAGALEAARACAKAQVKWPNDVVVDRKKIAGVLVESQVRGGNLGAVILGVGLNVGRLELPDEVSRIATSLAQLGATVTREALLADVVRALASRLRLLENSETPLAHLAGELNAYDALKGTHISVEGLAGVADGIDASGNLKVKDRNGTTQRVSHGHVSLWDEGETRKDLSARAD